jgi:hypothetical protein
MTKCRTVCPVCSGTKTVSQLCCIGCWRALPLSIRLRFSVAKRPERRQIVRALHAAWKEEAR